MAKRIAATPSAGRRGGTPQGSATGRSASDPGDAFAVHLLDVGPEEYGDAVLCQFGSTTVLIDGAHSGNWKDKGSDHPSIQRQIGELLGQSSPPYALSLLVVTHAHADHIGCLPSLVEQDLIAPEWALVADPDLGWGIVPGDSSSDVLAEQPQPVRLLAAALREEPRRTDDAEELAAFAADAASLEQRYRAMIDQLGERGTQVVRLGPDDLSPLLKKFKPIGLEILGPTNEVLVRCAQMNAGRSKGLSDAAHALLGDEADSADALTVADAYRRAVRAETRNLPQDVVDAVDALGKDKGSINDESIVTRFRYQNVNLLFTGDMQLAKPEVSDELVKRYITHTLRELLTRDAPYDLVKLPHHGSYNGFDEAVYQALGRPIVIGMCSGSTSKSHPNLETLDLLAQHRQNLRWARTDHNGRTTFTFNGDTTIDPNRGELNDTSPPGEDELPQSETAGAGRSRVTISGRSVGVGERSSLTGGPMDFIEVTARIPHVTTRVTLTADVAPARSGGASVTMTSRTRGGSGPGMESERVSIPASPRDIEGATTRGLTAGGQDLKVGGGRRIPRLLVLTNREALTGNIGERNTDLALDALRAAGHVVADSIVERDGVAEAKRLLNQHPDVEGVLLVGGYDVVHSRRIDALPKRLRDLFNDNSDADDFYVWSDDPYGDREGDELPELPVSRIPDGRSGDLVVASLQAGLAAAPEGSSGLRNAARPFADGIYAALPARAKMLQSRPIVFNPPDAAYSLDGQSVYVMLHGSDTDASRFWGEDNGHFPVAMAVENVPARPGMVAFTGCCWGALPVHTRAKDFVPGTPLGTWTPGLSIALTFLKKGARAFVGCTGSHYSPTRAPYGYFGGPMHEAFWRNYRAGQPPAQALFNAKAEYMPNIPHTQARDTLAEAIEFKIFREYTCLGLGW